MKKILAVTLTAMMLLINGLAYAQPEKLLEPSATFDLEVTLPEGASLEQTMVNGELSLIHILFEDEAMPGYTVMISYSEEYGQSMMADLTAEQLEALYQTIAPEMQDPSYEMRTLEDGIVMMVVNENTDNDYAYVITIYEGYFIQAYIAHDDYAPLTTQEVDALITLMDNVYILPPT